MNSETQRLEPEFFTWDTESDDEIAARLELLEEQNLDLRCRLDEALSDRADLLHTLRRAMVTLAGEAERQDSYVLQCIAEECATVLHGVLK